MSKEQYERDFICPKCHGHGAVAQEISMGLGGVARVLPLTPNRYLAVSCGLCGYTEFYQQSIVEKDTEEIPLTAKFADRPKI